jgi:uncharacterized protein (TIRG00374 family)
MKRWQSVLLGLLITIVTLYYAFHNVTWDTLGNVLAHGRYIYVLPALVFIFLGLLLRAFRWRSLLNQRLTLEHSFHILNASYLFYNILPFRLGEVVRMYMPTRLDPPISVFTNLSTVVVERFLDVLTVVIFAIVAIAMSPVAPPAVEAGARISGIIAVVGIVVLIIFAVRRDWAHQFLALTLRIVPLLKRFNLETFLDHLLDGIAPLGSLRGALAAVGWTAISWLASLMISYMMLLVFFDDAKLNALLLSISIASLAVAVPAAPGNIGPFEGAIVFGLTASGFVSGDPQQQSQALAYAVSLHIVSMLVYLVLGLFGLAQERISLGEVFRSARQMASRSNNEPISAEG